MRCPFCASAHSSVVDKRAVKSSGEIRRRRECLGCEQRYTTYERINDIERFVIKSDGRRQLFDRNKLKAGIERALEKRPAYSRVDEIVDKIEADLWAAGDREVESKEVGKAVLVELEKLDKIAYLRFASVYRQFTDLKDFTKELQHLKVLTK